METKYMVRCEIFENAVDNPRFESAAYEIYDTYEEALDDYEEQCEYLREDYIDGDNIDYSTITIFSMYEIEIISNSGTLGKDTYRITDFINQTIGQHGKII